jgi:hypothetical protein
MQTPVPEVSGIGFLFDEFAVDCVFYGAVQRGVADLPKNDGKSREKPGENTRISCH